VPTRREWAEGVWGDESEEDAKVNMNRNQFSQTVSSRRSMLIEVIFCNSSSTVQRYPAGAAFLIVDRLRVLRSRSVVGPWNTQ
jgi:hypothetical protein